MIVLDSSFLIAYHNQGDIHHAAAAETMERFLDGEWGRGLLLEYVFLEVVTVLRLRRNVRVATRVGELLLAARELRFEACSQSFLDAFEVFKHQGQAAGLSFVDAAVVAAARNHETRHVATFDHDLAAVPGLRAIPAAR